MAKENPRVFGRAQRVAWAAGLLLLPIAAAAQTTSSQPDGRGFIFGGALGGGQLSFAGAEKAAVALGPVDGQETISVGGVTTAYDLRSAWMVPRGASAAGAEIVVPFANQGAGGLSMHGGYAFNSHVAVLMDVGFWAGGGPRGYSQAVGSFVVRVWPVSRLWLEAGPAFGDLGYSDQTSTVRDGTFKGSGFTAMAGLSLLRQASWSLDLEARYSRIGYEAGVQANTLAVQLGAGRAPRRPKTRS
jgi:opacity protein-like surface antigen